MAVKQADVIARLRSGETMIRVIHSENGENKSFQYLSGGGRVTKATYRKLTDPDSNLMRPVSGGLFADSEPQEWAWAGA